MSVTFDSSSLLLLTDDGERMLAAWPIARGSKKGQGPKVCGWTYDESAWLAASSVSAPVLRRFANVFDRLAFVSAETGEIETLAASYLRQRVAMRLAAPKRPRKS